MVADALDIAGDGKIAADDAGTLLVGLIGDETGDILGDLLIEEIQVALHLLGLGQKTAVPTEHRVKAGLDVVLGHIQHPIQFLLQLADVDSGGAQVAVLAADLDGGQVFQVHLVPVLLRLLGQDTHRQAGQLIAQRK